jgi:hypothetical protein
LGHSAAVRNAAVDQLNSEAVETYFTSDPLAFMKERFIRGVGTIRRAGKSEGSQIRGLTKRVDGPARWMKRRF